jgi:hypothetical protein
MATVNVRTPAIWICAGAWMMLTGCEKSTRDDLGWARSSLERNGNLQVVSEDPRARAFTVRLKDTGELRIVRVDEIVGSLPSLAPAVKEDAPKPPEPAPALAANPPPPAAPPVTSTPPVATEAQITPAPAPPPTLTQMSEGPGVLKSGPGYVIKRTPTSGNERAAFAPAEAVARGLAVERREDPIICQGQRFLRIDSRNIEFAGDAVSAENGCELHITNSRIAAHGIGVSAHAANVYIENSSIEGQSGALTVSEGAQVYAEASSIRGVNRGLTTESLHDLGGNVWN